MLLREARSRPQIALKKYRELVMNDTKNTYSASSRGYTASQLQIPQVSEEEVAVYSCIAHSCDEGDSDLNWQVSFNLVTLSLLLYSLHYSF